jgi:hypothetical protein
VVFDVLGRALQPRGGAASVGEGGTRHAPTWTVHAT